MTAEEIKNSTFKLFNPLLLFSACCVSFNHGANDISHCVGIFLIFKILS